MHTRKAESREKSPDGFRFFLLLKKRTTLKLWEGRKGICHNAKGAILTMRRRKRWTPMFQIGKNSSALHKVATGFGTQRNEISMNFRVIMEEYKGSGRRRWIFNRVFCPQFPIRWVSSYLSTIKSINLIRKFWSFANRDTFISEFCMKGTNFVGSDKLLDPRQR